MKNVSLCGKSPKWNILTEKPKPQVEFSTCGFDMY